MKSIFILAVYTKKETNSRKTSYGSSADWTASGTYRTMTSHGCQEGRKLIKIDRCLASVTSVWQRLRENLSYVLESVGAPDSHGTFPALYNIPNSKFDWLVSDKFTRLQHRYRAANRQQSFRIT